MKKFATVILVLLMVLAVSTTAFAATGVNDNEKAVLDLLRSSEVMGANGWKFIIPTEYVNSAENYFAGDGDMTTEERDVILDCIKQGIEIIKKEANAQNFKGAEYKLSYMSKDAKTKVLDLGVKACAEMDLKLVYNSAANQVIITPEGSTTPIFESTPLVKTTGQEFALTTGTVAAGLAVILVAGTAVMFVVSKKTGLLAK